MSAKVDDGDDDDVDVVELDEFVDEFERWYKSSGESLNPYDAADRFIDYYANKKVYLPFARRKLLVMYVLSGTYIGILAMSLATFISTVISQITGDMTITWWFVSITASATLAHFITRMIHRCMARHESDVEVAVINYKKAIDVAVRPNGSLADWVNTVTKQRPPVDEPSDESDIPDDS
jgi:hypothetical protein